MEMVDWDSLEAEMEAAMVNKKRIEHKQKEEELAARWYDRIENMDPPNADPFKLLACAVILEAAKLWIPRGDRSDTAFSNTACRKFFLSEDYLFWSFMAGLNIEGSSILEALDRNGGINKEVARIIRGD